jgi:hypothetical protein
MVRRIPRLKQPMWKAIVTDAQLWAPVGVLAAGLALLALMR